MVYRVVLVGCGGMGRHHLGVLAELEGFDTVGLCDVSAAALAHQGEHGVPESARFTDFAAMYDELEPDIAVVATQTRGHHAPAVAALERGISVLCEKPIAIDLAEADEMVSAAEAGGAKLAINQQNHVNPGILRAQQMVTEGIIGDIVMVRGRNKHGRKSGNEFTEMGTHVTDMMLCFGSEPEWVAGTVYWQGRPVEPGGIMEAKEMSPRDRDSGPVAGDRAVAQYGFAGGVLGEIHFLGYETTLNTNYGVDVLGTEGQLAVRASGSLACSLWHLPRPMEGLPSDLGDWQAMDTPSVDATPIVTMYGELVAAMESGAEPPSSGREGRWAFEMILGIYESHRRGGGRITLPMSERNHPLEVWRASI
ncbi:MAG: Gfo/Idh/MocA family oxidoreductase [Candidatus Latescibacterota bacterium]|nr:Gfo/Idh/MocA family oxidoreductase [Candidatus Latescibacterota bacterium]